LIFRHRSNGVMVRVKFSDTLYRLLGPELIPVYRQSARRWLSHPPGGRLPLLSARPAVTSVTFHHMAPHTSTHPIPAYYSFIDPERMKGWVGLVGWPVADGLPTVVVTHQLLVERRTGKVHRPENDVLPLCHATSVMVRGLWLTWLWQSLLSMIALFAHWAMSRPQSWR